jgi:hypothetical protein
MTRTSPISAQIIQRVLRRIRRACSWGAFRGERCRCQPHPNRSPDAGHPSAPGQEPPLHLRLLLAPNVALTDPMQRSNRPVRKTVNERVCSRKECLVHCIAAIHRMSSQRDAARPWQRALDAGLLRQSRPVRETKLYSAHKLHVALSAVVTGTRTARKAGSKPPTTPMASAQTTPVPTIGGVTAR